MRVFISYARENGDVAARLAARLASLDHEIFYDKETLRNSDRGFHAEIFDWISRSELFVFLVSPHSVDMGFAINELDAAAEKWPNLSDGVMAFLIEETDLSEVDPRLTEALTIHTPRGDQVTDMARLIDQRERRTLAGWPKTSLGKPPARIGASVLGLLILGGLIAIIANWPEGTDESSTADTTTSTATTTTSRPERELTEAERLRQAVQALKDAGYDDVTITFGSDNKPRITGTVATQEAADDAASIAASYGLSVENDLVIVEPEPEPQPEPVILALIEPVRFDAGRHELSDAARSSLDDVARHLAENTGDALAIGGHTDNTGLATTNLELSQQRAEEAQRYLVDQKQVEADRVSLIGFGESRPVASNETVEGRASNRRLEFVTGTWNIYVVRPGDSLRRIAAAEYGDAQRWPDLYHFNRAWIDDPDRLRIGMELVVPPQG